MDVAFFTNLQFGDSHWSSTDAVVLPLRDAYYLNFTSGGGNQGQILKVSSMAAWAVRTGDVAAVPIPAAVWLFGSGLVGLFGLARRRARPA